MFRTFLIVINLTKQKFIEIFAEKDLVENQFISGLLQICFGIEEDTIFRAHR